MLDVLIVNPGNNKVYQSLASEFRGIEPPFWAGLIASYEHQKGNIVKILDADMENLSVEETIDRISYIKPKVICIVVQGNNPSASSTPKMPAVIDLVHKIKNENKNQIVTLTGLHPLALPDRSIDETGADYVCSLDILNNMPSNLWSFMNPWSYRAHNWQCLGNLKERTPYGIIYTSLNCPYNCEFCNIHSQYLPDPPGIKFRNIDDILKDLDILVKNYGVKTIKIMDELFVFNEDRVAAVCKAIKSRGYDLNMWAYARVDNVTPKMLDAMKSAGINWIAYGFESSSELSRLGVNKKFAQDKIDKVIKMTNDAGINIHANFIFGLPDDDYKSLNQTFESIKEYLFDWVNLYCCMAYPGSKLYDSVVISHPEYLPKTWDGYAQLGYETQPLPSKYLSPEEILSFRDDVFQMYFTYPPYLEKIKKKFGREAVTHINRLAENKLKRRLLGD